MKQFFVTSLMAMLLLISVKTFSETSHTKLLPYKKKGVSAKVDQKVFSNAIEQADKGNKTEFKKLFDCDFDKYVTQVKDNVNTYSHASITFTDANIIFMLEHGTLVHRHILKGTRIWGRLCNGTFDFYVIDFDFDGLVLTYEFTDSSGKTYQIDMILWDCFNPFAAEQIAVDDKIQTDTIVRIDTVFLNAAGSKVTLVDNSVNTLNINEGTNYQSWGGCYWTPIYAIPFCPGCSYYSCAMGCGLNFYFGSRGISPCYQYQCGGRMYQMYRCNSQTTNIYNNYYNTTVVNNYTAQTQTPRPNQTPGGSPGSSPGGGGQPGSSPGGNGTPGSSPGGSGTPRPSGPDGLTAHTSGTVFAKKATATSPISEQTAKNNSAKPAEHKAASEGTATKPEQTRSAQQTDLNKKSAAANQSANQAKAAKPEQRQSSPVQQRVQQQTERTNDGWKSVAPAGWNNHANEASANASRGSSHGESARNAAASGRGQNNYGQQRSGYQAQRPNYSAQAQQHQSVRPAGGGRR